MSVCLLDVNVLVSLMDSAHVHHGVTVAWFERSAIRGWATCPLTENGFLRVLSHVSYPNLRLTAAMAAESLVGLKTAFAAAYEFWPDHISMTDKKVFDLKVLSGARQISDAYLAGLAFRKGGRLATLDAAIPWQAVHGAGPEVVERLS